MSGLVVELREGVLRRQWRQVLHLADRVLMVDPQQMEAQAARARAWEAIETRTSPYPAPEVPKPTALPMGKRFLLWVDGIGGYLVCLSPTVRLGTSVAGNAVDVPLQADVGRMPASLTRDTEGYLLEAGRLVEVNGKPVVQALLRAGDEITLGAACRLRFGQPVAVSGTAQLEVLIGNRFPLGVEKVFLMAETLVLGSSAQSHVTISELAHPVIVYRHKEQLGIRHAGNLVVDGRPCSQRAALEASSRVCVDEVSFTLEPLPAQAPWPEREHQYADDTGSMISDKE